jgi:hypothetical protein
MQLYCTWYNYTVRSTRSTVLEYRCRVLGVLYYKVVLGVYGPSTLYSTLCIAREDIVESTRTFYSHYLVLLFEGRSICLDVFSGYWYCSTVVVQRLVCAVQYIVLDSQKWTNVLYRCTGVWCYSTNYSTKCIYWHNCT